MKQLHLIVRGSGLEASMSRYLVERIAALPNVTQHIGTEVVGLEGDRATGLSGAVFRERATGAQHRCDLRHLFLFVGADPNTGWLHGCVELDEKGFVLTGKDAAGGPTTLPSKPAARACLRSVTCAAARPSGSPPPSAKARRWWRRSTRRCPSGNVGRPRALVPRAVRPPRLVVDRDRPQNLVPIEERDSALAYCRNGRCGRAHPFGPPPETYPHGDIHG